VMIVIASLMILRSERMRSRASAGADAQH